MNPILPTRLKAESPGLGQANQTDIENRAAELARSDGRRKVTEADLEKAGAELAGGSVRSNAPDEASVTEELTAWDDPPDQAGHRVEGTKNEDAKSIAEQLIEDGIEEAEHDIRTAASEKKPE